MKEINKLALLLLVILIIISPIFIYIINKNSNKIIEQNSNYAQSYSKTAAQRAEKLEADYNAISQEIPGIVCIGSDLMASTGTISSKFANDIQAKLTDTGYKIPIVNLAVANENLLTILGRIGVIPFVIDEEVEIPTESDLISIKLESSGEGLVWPLLTASDNARINPVTVAGYTGMIGGENVINPDTGENNHFFVRPENGEPFTIPAGSVVNTSCDDEYKDYVHLIWVGENDEWSDYESLADYIQQIIDSCGKNKDRYLVMGMIKGTSEAMAEYDALMEEYFGDRFINVRKYLSEYDLTTTSISYNSNDIEQQKKGAVPPCMLQANGILNDDAYKLLTNYIYDELISKDCVKKPDNA